MYLAHVQAQQWGAPATGSRASYSNMQFWQARVRQHTEQPQPWRRMFMPARMTSSTSRSCDATTGALSSTCVCSKRPRSAPQMCGSG